MIKVDGSSGQCLPVGFVVVRGETLVYMRVQDHLRSMGLAQQAVGAIKDQVKRVGDWRFEQRNVICFQDASGNSRPLVIRLEPNRLRRIFERAKLMARKTEDPCGDA
jgi:hypothetical protein